MPKNQGEAFTKTDDEFDAWMSGARLPEKSVTVYGRADLVADLAELEEQLQAANQAVLVDERMNGGSSARAIAAKINAVQEEMKSSAMTFRFRSLPKATVKGIYADAPKVKDDDGEMTPDMDHVAVHWVAAACVSHNLTPAKVEQIQDRIGDGQFVGLWEAAFTASNEKRVSVPFSLAASMMRDEQDSSTN